MPDGDYLVWNAGGKWRKVHNLLRSGAPVVQIEDAVASAVASTIRVSGGVEELAAVADSIRQAAADDGEPAFEIARQASRAGMIGRLLDEVAPALVETMHDRLKLVSPVEATEVLAGRLVERIAEAGLDQLVPKLVADGRFTMTQLRELFVKLARSTQLAVLSDRFVRHPTGEGLLAPKRRTERKPLDKLIETGLDDL